MVKLIQKCKDSVFYLTELDGGEDPDTFPNFFLTLNPSLILTSIASAAPCCHVFYLAIF